MHLHNTKERRIAIATLLQAGMRPSQVAREVCVHRSTIARELARNSTGNGRYRADYAQKQANRRRREAKRAYRKIDNDRALQQRITRLLHPLRSPETVGHLLGVHHQTIYDWVYRHPGLISQLPHRGKRRRSGTKKHRKGWLRHARSIHDRPRRTPSWEGDTVWGSDRAALLTHVERSSLYLRADLLPNKEAGSVCAVLEQQPLAGVITYDCGSEFAHWRFIEEQHTCTVYFADPHAPWQRGKNENTNGRLRRVFPNGTDFATITNTHLQRIVRMMNDTPRKSLGWRTPADVFAEICCDSE